MSKFFHLLLFFSSLISLTSSDDFTDFVYTSCSQPKYALGSPYQFNVESLLASLANAAVFSSYANFTSAAASSSSPAYGLVQCRGDLPAPACASCVHSALSQHAALCPSAAGAAVQLRRCFLRYDNDSFLGKPDTGVLYKKCGPAAAEGYNSGLLAMRDAAVAGLITGGAEGSYRVGAAGYLRAVAQCGGDQSPKQCDECVAAAVAQLRDACGAAVAGDAYLGKCYASCWSKGEKASKTDHGDEAGKTVAIIIGPVAVITVFLSFLVTVFLSFLRKSENPENPGNTGNPENPGNTGNTGKPENPGNTEIPENPGNLGNPGKPDHPHCQCGKQGNPGCFVIESYDIEGSLLNHFFPSIC